MNVRVCSRITLMAVVLAAVSPVCADHWYEHYARAEKALIGADHEASAADDASDASGRSESWSPLFDSGDDLDGLLSARSPLLARAFRGDDRPRT